MANEAHQGQSEAVLTSRQDVMRYWNDRIRRPIENGQSVEGNVLQTFERSIEQFLNRSTERMGTTGS